MVWEAILFAIFIFACVNTNKKAHGYMWIMGVLSFAIGLLLSVLFGWLFDISTYKIGKLFTLFSFLVSPLVSDVIIWEYANDEKHRKSAKQDFFIGIIILVGVIVISTIFNL